MKLTILLLGIMLNISASTYSQATKLNLDLKDVSLKEVFETIKNQSEFKFIYSNTAIDDAQRLNINKSDASVEEILDQIRLNANFDYRIVEKQIVLFPSQSIKQEGVVKGIVKSASDGQPLPGVNVLIKGTDVGTVTDMDGNYTLSVPSSDAILQFSFIGFLTEETNMAGRTQIDMVLIESIESLAEVVVVGYGTVRKIDLTGSVASVKADDLPKTASTSIDNMIQGRVAGLTMNMRSAQPGGRLDMNIRGALSPRGDNAPLFVIDGVPIINNDKVEGDLEDADLGFGGGIDRSPLNTINPSDIESIDILKDASATAIYGSSAANGVVLITTKKGKEGKITVEYTGTYTSQKPKPYFDYLDAKNFMIQHERLAYEKYIFDNRLAPYGESDPSFVIPYVALFSDEDIANAGTGTNWLDEIMRNGSIQEHNLSIRGGSDKTKVYTSFSFYDNDAILKNSDFTRYTGRVNLDQQLTKKIKLGLNFTFSQINSNNAATGENSGGVEKYNMLQAAYSFSPTVGIFDEEGNYTKSFDPLISNPAAFLIVDDKLQTGRILITPNLQIDIIDGLKLNVVGGIDQQTAERSYYLPKKFQNAMIPEGMAQNNSQKIGNYTTESYLTYNKVLENSSVTAVFGAGFYKSMDNGFGLAARGFFTDAFSNNRLDLAENLTQTILNSYRHERTKLSQFARFNYAYQSKYLLSVVARRDGSSIFAENKQWGVFPGISAGWRISEESFMDGTSMISDLKLRAGYGTSGNESVLVGNAQKLYQPGLSYQFGDVVRQGVTLSQLNNDDLSWETNVTINLGLDISLWSNRLTLAVDYFDRTAKDLLDFAYLPSNNIIVRYFDNVGSTKSTGYEFMLTSHNLTGAFSWKSNFNISSYNSHWVERNPDDPLPSYIGETDGIREIYGWETNGIIKSEDEIPDYMPDAIIGNAIFVDQNKDGLLDTSDVVSLGTVDPKLSFGFGNTFTFMGFDLNIYLYGMTGRQLPNGFVPGGATSASGTTTLPIALASPNNVLTTVKDVWSIDNPEGMYPGVAANAYAENNPTDNSHLSREKGSTIYEGIQDDFYMMDASFIRLKNITFGYTLPKVGILSKVQSARIFVDLQNVAVFTKYEGFDPEFSEFNPYPQAMSTSFGLNVSF